MPQYEVKCDFLALGRSSSNTVQSIPEEWLKSSPLLRATLSAQTQIKQNNKTELLYRQNKHIGETSECYVHAVILKFSVNNICSAQTITSLVRFCYYVRDFIAHGQ